MTRPKNPESHFAMYRELSKSGIVTLVLISVLGGYLIGQPAGIPLDLARMALTLVGVLFLASGSSALNQFQERHEDAAMPRTAQRPLPSGRLKPAQALTFVVVTLTLGLAILFYLGKSEALLGFLAVISYNGLYTLWWKRRWAFAAVPGAIPGALPILIGHVAAQGNVFHPGGIYLFLILFFWQMPHFWVLALRYKKDYELGSFPTLPVALGDWVTVHQITLWCLAYIGISLVAPFFLPVGTFYLGVAIPVCLKVLWELRAYVVDRKVHPDTKKWLHFFLWVNFSLIIFLLAAVLDLWQTTLLKAWWTR